jgi:hypothetical protein
VTLTIGTIDKAIHAIRDILALTAQQERPGQQPSFLLDSSVLASVSSSVVNDDLKKKELGRRLYRSVRGDR